MGVETQASTSVFHANEESTSDDELDASCNQAAVGGEHNSPGDGDVKRKRDATDADAEYHRSACGPSIAEGAQTKLQGDAENREGPVPKRTKLSDGHVSARTSASSKRSKVHGLPPRLWKRILSLLPPVFLGRLLRVSRDFNSLLTTGLVRDGETSEPDTFDPETIWLASHRRYAAGLPDALPGQSELEMWRLVRGTSCQLCNLSKTLLTTNAVADPWRPSEDDGVRVIWPFGVRCCVACLQDRIEQESSLHFSSSLPSFLLPTLPCVFLSSGKHYVHSWAVKNTALPQGIQLSKVYYKPHLGNVKEVFERKKADSPDGAKAWVLKLENENEARIEAIIKWEQWETKGGLKKVNVRPPAKHTSSSKQSLRANGPKLQTKPAHTATDQVPNSNDETNHVAQIQRIPDSNGLLYSSGANDGPYPPTQSLTPGGLPPRPAYQAPSYRLGRDLRDVTEAKASRRSEIERRCLELDPPIPENILRHMDSFQAALQIPQSLTEQAWELLKPRLLDQRQAAEKEESEQLEREKTSRALAHDRTPTTSQTPDANPAANVSRAPQASVQDRLSIYAEERIRDLWSNGATVNLATCPTFAADVLLHVKRRFDDDQTPAPAEDVLILEHMKWLFDNKIRPLTDPYNKEIFLCSVCEGISKYYGFEAVIQHYAAKHTSALSQGSVVVHWRAKWPDQAPFHPNPNGPVSNFTTPMPATNVSQRYPPVIQPPSGISSGSYGHQVAGPAPYIHGYPAAPTTPSFAHSPSYQQSTGPPPYPDQYASVAPIPQGYSAAIASPSHIPPPGFHSPHPSQWPSQMSPIGPPQQQGAFPATQIHQSQMGELGKFARDVWFSTGGVREMPASLRIYVVIQHVVNRFAQAYSMEPTLAMFLEGLNQNPLMRPVRSLNGLMCKTCASQSRQGSRPEGERKVFTLPLLLNHFKSMHLENGGVSAHLNWKNDMVQLPDAATMLPLVNAPGMDAMKLTLLAQVLPGVFPFPLPNTGSQEGATAVNPGSQLVQGANFSTAEVSTHSAALVKITASERRSRSRTREAEIVGEDEYDPHRPAYLEVRQAMTGRQQSHVHPSAPNERSTARPPNDRAAGQAANSGTDYDPNEPLIHYGRKREEIHSQSRHAKPETYDADLFLEKLRPEIKTEYAPPQWPIEVPAAASPKDLHERYYQQEPMSPGNAYLERREHAGYDRSGPLQYYNYPPDEQQVLVRRDVYQAPQGSYNEAERLPPHMRERDRGHPEHLVRQAQVSRPVQYHPAIPPDRSRPGVVYVAHSPDGYGPVHYHSVQAPHPYPPERGYGHRPRSASPEERERRIERIPMEFSRHGPRYPSPLRHAQVHAVEGEAGRSYGEAVYASRAPPEEGEERVYYREYR